MPRGKVIISLIGSMAALGAASLVVPAAAHTSTGTSVAKPHVVSKQSARTPMHAVDINKKVAEQHGYTVLNLSDGSEASILNTKLKSLGKSVSDTAIKSNASSVISASSDALKPDNTIYGDCGDSYYYLSIYSDGTWSSITGYDVRAAVSSKDWETFLQNPEGSQIESTEYSPAGTGASWEGSDNNPPELTDHGTWLGGVGHGSVQLVDGTSCNSGDPADTATF